MNQVCLNQCWNVAHVCGMKMEPPHCALRPALPQRRGASEEGASLAVPLPSCVSEDTKARINWVWQHQPGLISGHPHIHLNTNSLFLQSLCWKTDQEDFSKPCGVIPITFKLWPEFIVGKGRVAKDIVKTTIEIHNDNFLTCGYKRLLKYVFWKSLFMFFLCVCFHYVATF